MRRFMFGKLVAAALLALPLLALPSQAAFLPSYFVSGVENQLSDQSLETVTRGGVVINPALGLQVGDKFTGVIVYPAAGQVGQLKQIPTSQGEVKAIFSVDVTAVSGNNITFGADASFGATYGTGAAAALFETDGATPLNNLIATGGSTLAQYETAATTGTFLASVGFVGPNTIWTATTGLNGTGNFANNLNLVTGATFNGNTGVLDDPTTFKFAFAEFTGIGGPTQFGLPNGGFRPNSNSTTNNVFSTVDNGSVFFTVTVVPEPASIVMMTVGLAGIGFGALRRRSKACS